MPSPDSITVPQLLRLIGTPEAPIIIDVRFEDDFDADPRLIPGGFHHSYLEIDALVPRLRGRKVAVVCQKGRKLSQGATATLQTYGIDAEHLEGGTVAWKNAGGPMVPVAALPPRNAAGETLWVTRHRPKIDRMACPWLIRRFVDPSARFLFVSPSEVPAVAEHFGATPFDIQDVFWSHRGELCTFDVMVEEFGLVTEPLLRLSTIVRAADTDRHDLAPQAAGLLAASLGLSRMYKDDLRQLEAGMLLYDAFYRWSRDAVDEGHNWPTGQSKG
ncbi:sulfurtransferase/chromate resistance protein [Nisaea acidiphila]|uniref:Sulfurtransferase/chromate resistance protein n=1 Tax=Nisaea acidiphila TaxID=1862145 RepID=A0A9J7AS13_9PROT|nr:sulfurtransferase/chromate resistance protein [Nisaea acidiphila]UUX49658.1 sulfurtransferase/chromate resistance protein [Nisaea acidiphila]